jgi:hypothetical protein
MAACTAIAAALTLAYVGHYDFGFSRQQIRFPALVAAGVIVGESSHLGGRKG